MRLQKLLRKEKGVCHVNNAQCILLIKTDSNFSCIYLFASIVMRMRKEVSIQFCTMNMIYPKIRTFFTQNIISFDLGLKDPDIFMCFSILEVDEQL